jgi:hypothetical protein
MNLPGPLGSADDVLIVFIGLPNNLARRTRKRRDALPRSS